MTETPSSTEYLSVITLVLYTSDVLCFYRDVRRPCMLTVKFARLAWSEWDPDDTCPEDEANTKHWLWQLILRGTQSINHYEANILLTKLFKGHTFCYLRLCIKGLDFRGMTKIRKELFWAKGHKRNLKILYLVIIIVIKWFDALIHYIPLLYVTYLIFPKIKRYLFES